MLVTWANGGRVLKRSLLEDMETTLKRTFFFVALGASLQAQTLINARCMSVGTYLRRDADRNRGEAVITSDGDDSVYVAVTFPFYPMPKAMRSAEKMPAGTLVGGTKFVYELRGIRDTTSKNCTVGVKFTPMLHSVEPSNPSQVERTEIEAIKAQFHSGN